jgi:hypothetical protein
MQETRKSKMKTEISPDGSITQKTVLFIVSNMGTSNVRFLVLILVCCYFMIIRLIPIEDLEELRRLCNATDSVRFGVLTMVIAKIRSIWIWLRVMWHQSTTLFCVTFKKTTITRNLLTPLMLFYKYASDFIECSNCRAELWNYNYFFSPEGKRLWNVL